MNQYEKYAAWRYRTVKAPGGRKICKIKSFTPEEKAYCRLQTQLYSNRVALSLDTKLTHLNLNTIVFGGSGAGKSRYYVKPNILQANSSYVITDPSGELLLSSGDFLEKQGYVVKCLNIENMSKSMRYNPFAYIKEDADIPVMVDALLSNIEGPKKGGGGDNKFWDETSRTLLIAICGYLFETQPMEKRNFTNVVKLIDMMDASDDRVEAFDELDLLFNDLELANPDSYAVSNYKVIKSAGTGKTAQNIIISTLAIFARFFKMDKIKNLMYKDELHLEELGQKKCALFIVTPQASTTYNFIAAELYTQLFDILYKQGSANAEKKGSTDVAIDIPVRCMIDEAANIGNIPHLENTIATCRKYGISISLIYQNKAQIESLFDKKWEDLVGNCDTWVFLGGIDPSTTKLISERLGKQTIKVKNHSVNKGKNGGGSESSNATGRQLLTESEIASLNPDMCLVFIRTMHPFQDRKYDLEHHPNYKYSGDASSEYVFRAPWHIELDHEQLSTLDVKRKDEEGYIAPERVSWVSEADIERVKKDQAMRAAAANSKNGGGFTPASNQSAPVTANNNVTMASTAPVQTDTFSNISGVTPQMSDDEKERIKNVLRDKNINLGLEEETRIFGMSFDEAMELANVKDGYSPDMEFTDDDFKFDVSDTIADIVSDTEEAKGEEPLVREKEGNISSQQNNNITDESVAKDNVLSSDGDNSKNNNDSDTIDCPEDAFSDYE